VPIIDLAGNVGLILCAFSYAGQVFLAVTADASAFPDPDVLMAGMEREWHALIGRVAPNSSNVASPAAQAAERT
jgi:hypothetical protein